VPAKVSLELPPALSVSATVPVALLGSETLRARVAVPILSERAVTLRVRMDPVPEKEMLELGTSAGLEVVALRVRTPL